MRQEHSRFTTSMIQYLTDYLGIERLLFLLYGYASSICIRSGGAPSAVLSGLQRHIVENPQEKIGVKELKISHYTTRNVYYVVICLTEGYFVSR